MSTRTITCPDCGGEGRHIPLGFLSEVRCERCKGHGHLVVDDCGHCHGRGYLPDTARAKP